MLRYQKLEEGSGNGEQMVGHTADVTWDHIFNIRVSCWRPPRLLCLFFYATTTITNAHNMIFIYCFEAGKNFFPVTDSLEVFDVPGIVRACVCVSRAERGPSSRDKKKSSLWFLKSSYHYQKYMVQSFNIVANILTNTKIIKHNLL